MRKLIILKVKKFAELPQLVNARTRLWLQAPDSIFCALEYMCGVWRMSELTCEVGLLSHACHIPSTS